MLGTYTGQMSRFGRDGRTATGLNRITFNVICMPESIAAVVVTARAGARGLSRDVPRQVQIAAGSGSA